MGDNDNEWPAGGFNDNTVVLYAAPSVIPSVAAYAIPTEPAPSESSGFKKLIDLMRQYRTPETVKLREELGALREEVKKELCYVRELLAAALLDAAKRDKTHKRSKPKRSKRAKR